MELLRRIWETWKRVGKMVGDFIGRVVLTIFYFTILVPFGLGVRLLSDPLRMKRASSPQWLSREMTGHTLEDARRQY
jgi:hypothetical protein